MFHVDGTECPTYEGPSNYYVHIKHEHFKTDNYRLFTIDIKIPVIPDRK